MRSFSDEDEDEEIAYRAVKKMSIETP